MGKSTGRCSIHGASREHPERCPQKIQLDALAYMCKLAQNDPNFSVKICVMVDLTDDHSIKKVWYQSKLPKLSSSQFRVSSKEELPLDANFGMSCMDRHILINCSGSGTRFLKDVADEDMKFVKGQTMLVKADHDKILICRGKIEYTYVPGHGDGTAILGKAKNWGSVNKHVHPETRADIFRRIHENIPDSFPMEPKDNYIVRDITAIRPQKEGDARNR
ncbi:hypothetical protein BDV97DRAFT_373289 [Delphinella strobiligena]|nr:hypothetical protein BDV97DRAFT_373289 [Delphinella strobiligena]